MSWLAWQMLQHNTLIFSIDRLDLNWLSSRQRIIALVIIGIPGGVGCLLLGTIGRLTSGAMFGFSTGIIVGILINFISLAIIIAQNRSDFDWESWTKRRRALLQQSLNSSGNHIWFGFGLGIMCGFAHGIFTRTLMQDQTMALILLLSFTFSGGGMGILVTALLRQLLQKDISNNIVQTHHPFLIFVVGLLLGIIMWLVDEFLPMFRLTMTIGTIIYFLSGVIGASVTIAALVYQQLEWLLVRLFLSATKIFPWRYQDFLDSTVDKRLMKRLAERYTFWHGLLLQHFAAGYQYENHTSLKQDQHYES